MQLVHTKPVLQQKFLVINMQALGLICWLKVLSQNPIKWCAKFQSMFNMIQF